MDSFISGKIFAKEKKRYSQRTRNNAACETSKRTLSIKVKVVENASEAVASNG